MGKLVNKRELAEWFGVAERTLTRWQQAGMPIEIEGKRGQSNMYDSVDVMRWKAAQDHQGGEVGHEPEFDELAAARELTRLRRAQAEKYELQNAVTRRENAPVEVIEWVLGKIGAQVVALLDAVPLKVKRRVPKLTAGEVELIKVEISKALNLCAKLTVDFDEFDEQLRRHQKGAEEGADGLG